MLTIKMVLAAAVVCALAFGVVALVFWQARRAARRRVERHISNHRPMSDLDFLAQLKVEPRRHAECLAVRRAMARMTGLPAETIYPQDNLLQDLLVHGFVGFSIDEFHAALEAEAMARLDRGLIAKALNSQIPKKLSEYIEQIAPHWDGILKRWPSRDEQEGAQVPAVASGVAKPGLGGEKVQ